ncbi:MAG: hypothetical protein ACFB51_21275 [Anaerolineae bacterium]
MAEMQLARRTFKFRFSATNPRDIDLAKRVQQDIDDGVVNMSEVIKGLLREWYKVRDLRGEIPSPDTLLATTWQALPSQPLAPKSHSEHEEEGIDPNDPVARALLSASFDDF